MTNYFADKEFACHHCGQVIVSPILRERLNKAREAYGAPMLVTSGYRCPEHNSAVGGSPTSAHLYGEAADIHCPNGSARLKMLKSFIDAGFVRIGIGGSFIHVDVSIRDNHPQNVAWVYAGGDDD